MAEFFSKITEVSSSIWAVDASIGTEAEAPREALPVAGAGLLRFFDVLAAKYYVCNVGILGCYDHRHIRLLFNS